MQNLHPPEQVVDIARRLEASGFETWCVGGAVRDALLGHAHLDWDFATSARPEQVRELFGHRRTIPVGIEFGTVGVLDSDGVMHEVTTFRRDVKTDGRHAEVEFGVSLDEDLARRDFTINAMAWSPTRAELRDPFDGRKDLEAGIVRAVGDAAARMREDRLRALRGIRFASRFGFRLDPPTLQAIRESAPHMGRLSAERVKQELEKTMDQVARPGEAFRLWKSTGAFATLVPGLAEATDEALSVPDHLAMPGPARRPQRRILRIAGLLAGLDPQSVTKTLTDLRFSKQETAWASTVVGRWRALGDDIGASLVGRTPASDATVRAWVAAIGRLHVGAVMRLAMAVWAGRREAGKPYPEALPAARLYRRMVKAAFRDPIELRDLAVDGEDLKKAGIAGGRELGRILQALMQRVLEDPTRNTTDWLLQEGVRLYRTDAVAGTQAHKD
ncbi:MAG TPA: CCA tRNA nucleotidyltransferase [Gemmatimonadaceae bacterium]|nr:CCA tRNA nucleotidyltransferase [Gemmatimonadaceae bacterium]